MSLRLRLFVLVSAIVAATVGLATWTVAATARRAFESVDAQRTAALVSQFRREFAREADDVAVRIDRVAATDSVKRMALEIATSVDRAAVVNEAAALAAAQGLDFLDIVDANGTIVSSAHWPARYGYKHPLAKARVASAGAFLASVEVPGDSALGLIAIRRVGSGDRSLYVVGGRRLDRQFLQSLVLPAGMRALIYRNNDPELSRSALVDASGPVADASALTSIISRVRETKAEQSDAVQWPNGPETVNAIPLAGSDGAVLGILLVGSSGRELAGLLDRIRWSGALFAFLGIALGFALSYAVALRVTRPVERLADAARMVAGGDWSVRVADASSDEIGQLAAAFDRMTAELADQRERLVQAERVAAWRELARRLAHELKNPLFPLRITIDNLRRARALPPREFEEVLNESVVALSSGLASLNGVVTQFSDFARMPAPQFEQVPVNTIVEESLSLFRAQLDAAADRPAIAVALDLDAAAGSVRGDPDQLRRAIQNLLLNAIDAMPAGGTLTVRTRRLDASVRLDVADTGSGLTEEERCRLFTPYYTTKQHGTGLGLAIVQSVVADHAGKIWVDSEPGQGAVFHVELPLSPPDASRPRWLGAGSGDAHA